MIGKAPRLRHRALKRNTHMHLYHILEKPIVYRVVQAAFFPTVWIYKDLIARHLLPNSGDALLDLGCGLGVARKLFPDVEYTGVDSNERYIEIAKRRLEGRFLVMDATNLDLPADYFDHAISVALCHHLTDDMVGSLLREAFRVLKPGRYLHIVDPVLPISPISPLRRLVFYRDRGRYQRSISDLSVLLGSHARIARIDFRRGPLHDVAYFCIAGQKTSLQPTD